MRGENTDFTFYSYTLTDGVGDRIQDFGQVATNFQSWINAWKRNGWKTADRKPVKNAELWRELDELAARHVVRWHWVRGHSGHDGNERADELANRGVAEVAGR